MKTIGSFDAKTHLSRILDEVSKGENYIITKHGTPIAELRPFSSDQGFNWEETKQTLQQLRRKVQINGEINIEELKEWRDEGRK